MEQNTIQILMYTESDKDKKMLKKDEKILEEFLVGQKIKNARWLSKSEALELGWEKQPLVIELENGVQLVPISDDEGNDAGSFLTTIKALQVIYVNRD